MTATTIAAPAVRTRTKLNRQQIVGFWVAWVGWVLDGMDSVIYALVLAPALTELIRCAKGRAGAARRMLAAVA